MKASIAERIQATLLQENLDDSLVDSFRGSDSIAHALVGKKKVYLPWQQLLSYLSRTIVCSWQIATQYFPLRAISNISSGDAVTVELVRSFDLDVVSSALVTGQPIQTHVTLILSL